MKYCLKHEGENENNFFFIIIVKGKDQEIINK